MNDYVFTSTMTIAVPESMCPVAATIAQAFDPRSGGSESFDSLRATDSNGEVWAVAHSPCTPEVAAALPYLKSTPGLLFQSVSRDYELRWPGTEMPTLEQCEEFRQAIMTVTGETLDDALESIGLTLTLTTEAITY